MYSDLFAYYLQALSQDGLSVVRAEIWPGCDIGDFVQWPIGISEASTATIWFFYDIFGLVARINVG